MEGVEVIGVFWLATAVQICSYRIVDILYGNRGTQPLKIGIATLSGFMCT